MGSVMWMGWLPDRRAFPVIRSNCRAEVDAQIAACHQYRSLAR
jgi:hypothetical protein